MQDIIYLIEKHLNNSVSIDSIDKHEGYIHLVNNLNKNNEKKSFPIYFQEEVFNDSRSILLYGADMFDCIQNNIFKSVSHIESKIIDSFCNSFLCFLKKIDSKSFLSIEVPTNNNPVTNNINYNINSIVKKIKATKNYVLNNYGIFEEYCFYLSFEPIHSQKADLNFILYFFNNIDNKINVYTKTVNGEDFYKELDEYSFSDDYFISLINIRFKENLKLINLDCFDIDNFKEQFKLIQMYSI